MASAPTWFWPVSDGEGEYIAATGLTLNFPPGQTLEIRVIEEDGDDV